MRSGGEGPVAGNMDHENCGLVTTSAGFTICARATAARVHAHASSRAARRAAEARGVASIAENGFETGSKGTEWAAVGLGLILFIEDTFELQSEAD